MKKSNFSGFHFLLIPLPVGHTADSVFIIESAVLVRVSNCACFYLSVLLSDAAFGRREAPGRRLAGGGGALRAPLGLFLTARRAGFAA